MRTRVNRRALAHIVEKPPTNCVTTCGTRTFDSLAPSVFIQRRIAHVRIVVAPGEVRTREENFLAVIEQVRTAHGKSRRGKSRNHSAEHRGRK